jgi:8-oxo-dGTP pyrophosphatase MutT (NUDIX family)
MKKTRSGGGIVLNDRGEVAVVSQHGTSWSLPKGHLKAGEDDEAAARREIREEAGLTDLVLVRQLGEYRRFRLAEDGSEDRTELKTIAMFLFRTDQQELRPEDSVTRQALWLAKDKVADKLTHARDREFFLSVADELE